MSATFLRKYAIGSGADIHVPIIKEGSVNYAVGADWTPAAGDVKVSIDGGSVANINTLPTALASGNGAWWKFVFTNGELTGKSILVMISDSSTKAISDQAFIVETYGNASAQYVQDLAAPQYNSNITQILGQTATATGNILDVNAKTITNGIIAAATFASGALDAVWSTAARTLTAFSFAVDISATGLAAIWNRLTSALTTAGSIGKLLVDNIDAAISSRSTFAGGAVSSVTGNVGGNVVGNVNGNVVGNVGGNVVGSVASVAGNIGGNVAGSVNSVTSPVTIGTNNDKTGYGLSATALTNVNSEVVDALNVDTYPEPGQANPPATASVVTKLGYIYKGWRNKKDNNGTENRLYADDGSTVDQKQATTDSLGTVTKGEWFTGP